MRTKKNKAALIRLQRDFEDLGNIPDTKLIMPDPDNLQNFIMRIRPTQGIWANANFDFEFKIPDDFPFGRPSVKCLTRIWHPNIEETGAVCLNILRDNYTPVLELSMLVVGLQYLFSDPNPHSPLNKEASEQYLSNYSAFTLKAQEYKRLYCPQ